MAGETEVFCFPNGNAGVCRDGEQIPELQRHPWILVYAEFLERTRYRSAAREVQSSCRPGVARLFRIEGGYNWRIEES